MLWGLHRAADAEVGAAEGTESGEVCGGEHEEEFGGGLEWIGREGCFALAMRSFLEKGGG